MRIESVPPPTCLSKTDGVQMIRTVDWTSESVSIGRLAKFPGQTSAASQRTRVAIQPRKSWPLASGQVSLVERTEVSQAGARGLAFSRWRAAACKSANCTAYLRSGSVSEPLAAHKLIRALVKEKKKKKHRELASTLRLTGLETENL